MLRKDREITDVNEIIEFMNDCKVCHLAMVDNEGKPYSVPLNFGFEYENNGFELYFHCALKGKKIDILKNNPSVFFSMETGGELQDDEIACKVGYYYKSVLGSGNVEFIEDRSEKAKILRKICIHMTGRDFPITEKETGGVAIIKLKSNDVTAKARKK